MVYDNRVVRDNWKARKEVGSLLTPFHSKTGPSSREIKLTGILNTYVMNLDEDTHGLGHVGLPR